jgi:cytochrome c oxidase subunit 2
VRADGERSHRPPSTRIIAAEKRARALHDPPDEPPTLTTQAALMQANWVLFLIVGGAVAVVVWGLILFAIVRWRRPAGSDPGALPPQFRSNNVLEIGWTIVPLVIVGALFVHTYRAEAGVDALVARPDVTVNVNAYRWGWTFAYVAGPTVGGSFANPPQLVLPRDETTRIVLTSSDVNHAFWVPAFLFKRDAIPGLVNRFDLHPLHDGTYAGHCAEFCGYAHALMGFRVKVVSPDDYRQWLKGHPE